MTMTEEELERRARKLCEMRGKSPSDPIPYGTPGVWRTRVEEAKDELREWDQCRRVMEEPVAERELKAGDRVRMGDSLGAEGVVLAVGTKSNGEPVALVEWDDHGHGATRLGSLERIS